MQAHSDLTAVNDLTMLPITPQPLCIAKLRPHLSIEPTHTQNNHTSHPAESPLGAIQPHLAYDDATGGRRMQS